MKIRFRPPVTIRFDKSLGQVQPSKTSQPLTTKMVSSKLARLASSTKSQNFAIQATASTDRFSSGTVLNSEPKLLLSDKPWKTHH